MIEPFRRSEFYGFSQGGLSQIMMKYEHLFNNSNTS